jgi:tRNA dihydrouridine synthase A
MEAWKSFILAALFANIDNNKNEFHIAPMQGYTNHSLRTLFHFLSPSSIKWTEMEKVNDLYPNFRTALEKRLASSAEKNLVLQLGSNDCSKLESCVDTALKHYPDLKEINLNCGCPAIDSGGAPDYGASLMKDPSLTAELVKTVSQIVANRSTNTNISVKCRIAVINHVDDLKPLQEQEFSYLKDYISGIVDAGANHAILHARPAILSGLSPVKNRIVPDLDYAFVERIASEFHYHDGIKVTLNGGIKSLSQLKSLQQKQDGLISSHMAGRWILRRPLDLLGIENLLSTESDDHFLIVHNTVKRYLEYALQMANDSCFTTAELCLPLYLVVEQLREDYEEDELHEEYLLSYEEMESLYDSIQDGIAQLKAIIGTGRREKNENLNSLNFKRLSASFKSLVGTKVVNKWKRNRAEL